MKRFIKITVVALSILAVVFAAPAVWAMGSAGQGGGRGAGWGGWWGGEHGRGWGGEHSRGSGGGGGHGVPEIDPGIASSAIALLTCSVLILTKKPGRK